MQAKHLLLIQGIYISEPKKTKNHGDQENHQDQA